MNPSSKCRALTTASEGKRLSPYDDATGLPVPAGGAVRGTLTVGYGHTGPDVVAGEDWTDAQCDAALDKDLETAGNEVSALVKIELTQGQFDALTDFVFNEGSGRLKWSTVLSLINQGRLEAVPDALCSQDEDGNWHGWVYAQGKVSEALVRRRQAEIALWRGE